MLFNSLSYLLFLPTVAFIFFSVRVKWRWLILLLAGYIFYMLWNPAFILVLFSISTITFFSSLGIEKISGSRHKNILFYVSLGLILFVLIWFKYMGYISYGFSKLFYSGSFRTSDIILPAGISFYTFQALAYLIDVKKNRFEAEHHFGKFLLFLAFFPLLFSGPIERAKKLLSQINHLNQKADYADISAGAKLFLMGLFKKTVIADNLSFYVDMVFSSPANFKGFELSLAVLLYTFQLYCDFSAYIDMARGSARILGFNLSQNFNRPFVAVNIADFWKRWHITLSTWFRDYVFLPLAWKISKKIPLTEKSVFSGNLLIYSISVTITFAATGIWHGANITFLIWGLLHAALLIIEFATQNSRKNIRKLLRIKHKSVLNKFISITITFTLINLTFIFFRANHLNDAMLILNGIFSDWQSISIPDFADIKPLFFGIMALVLLLVTEFFMKEKSFDEFLNDRPTYIRWMFYYMMIAAVFMFGYFGNVEFIYFQF